MSNAVKIINCGNSGGFPALGKLEIRDEFALSQHALGHIGLNSEQSDILGCALRDPKGSL